MPPIDAYEIGADGTHMAVPPSGGTPPGTRGSSDAADASQTGAPGATSEPPAVAHESAGAPPAPPTPSPGEGEGVDSEDDAPEAVTLEDFNRHMARLRRRQRSAERALEAERQQHQVELAQIRGQQEALQRMLQGAAPELPAPPPAGPPQAEQFTSHEDYVLAAARYGAQQELQAREQQTQQERQVQQQQQMQRELMEREAAFKQAHPDFDEVVRTGLAGKVAPHVQQALMLLPEGPALAYTLAQQQDLVARLNTLPPPLVFAELGRLMPGTPPPAATGETPPAAPTNGTRPPPLPEPMRPVGGGGSPTPPGFNDSMSQEDYRAWRARTSNLPRWKTG